MSRTDRLFSLRTPIYLWALLILAASVVSPPEHAPLLKYNIDKVVHFLMYAVLAMLIMRPLNRVRDSFFIKKFSFTLISGGGYGILMELVQWVIPGREASLYDVYANITGIVFGTIIGEVMLWRR